MSELLTAAAKLTQTIYKLVAISEKCVYEANANSKIVVPESRRTVRPQEVVSRLIQPFVAAANARSGIIKERQKARPVFVAPTTDVN